MESDWRDVRLGDLVAQGALSISDGYRVRNEELGPYGIPFVRGGDIGDGWINTATADHIRPELAERVQNKLTRPGDIAFITKGTVGRAGFLRPEQPPVVFAPQVAYWRVLAPDVLDARFLFYLIRSRGFQSALDAVKTRGAMVADYVSISLQHEFKFKIPGIRTQRAIAHILGTLDDKIELNRRMAETLEAMARALFKSWFVDFDPVRAKAEGRPTGLPDEIAALFPTTFDVEDKPEGWATNVASIANLVRNSIHPSEVAPDTCYVGLEHIEPRRLGLQSWGAAGDVDSSKIAFRQGDLLFGKLRPYFHKVCIAPFDGISSSEIFVFRPVAGVPASYLYLAFSEASFVATASAAPSGTRMPRADWPYMAQKSAIRPNVELLKAFDAAVGPMLKKLQTCLAECQTLGALRDTLLPRLISGELRIRDAESAIEAA